VISTHSQALISSNQTVRPLGRTYPFDSSQRHSSALCSPCTPQKETCRHISLRFFLEEWGAESEKPAHHQFFLCKCLMFVDFLWRVGLISARVGLISARVGLISARVCFFAHPYISLSKSLKIKKKTVKKEASEPARVGARVSFYLRGLGTPARLNPRRPAQWKSYILQRFLIVKGQMRGCAGCAAPAYLLSFSRKLECLI